MKRQRIRGMFVKEFIQVFRDPRLRAMVFLMPVVQLVLFGYAVTTDVRNVALAVCDLDRSEASRDLAARFESSGRFRIVRQIRTDREIAAILDRGDAQAVLAVGPGFGAAVAAARPATVQLLLDGTDSNSARIILDYAAQIVAGLSDRVRLLAGPPAAAGPPGLLDVRMRAGFNENLESRNFYVPGVIAMLVMLITLMLTSMAVVREKEIGTMEQIIVTPITQMEFILGKTAPFALLAFVDVLLITAVAVFWFDVPIRGHLATLLAASVFYVMTSLGIGLLISTVSGTQQQAMMTTFFFYFPAILLSGFMFPIANMPEPIQGLTYVNPLRYFLVIVRGIFLKGTGWAILWPQILVLACMGTATLWLAGRRFHKTAG